MNKEELDNIMNCKCLQSIIENDKNSHNRQESITRYEEELTIIETPIDKGEIIFNCFTIYRRESIRTNEMQSRLISSLRKEDEKSIPLFYCPICSTKTKHTITQDSFYYQFQNE